MNLAIEAAIKAGEKITEIYQGSVAGFSVERKADNSPLTIADKASHQVIENMLQSTGLPILSEEGNDIPYEERKQWNMFWMVDPLDGTKEFIKRNGEFTVNIALISNRKPSAGIIYVPVCQTLYVGITGQGAWKLEKAGEGTVFETLQQKGVQLPGSHKPQNYTVAGSRSHANQETQEYINNLKKKHPHIDTISKGSSLKICMVAEGTANEYPRFGPTMEWDTAAGHAIANASGKKLWLTGMDDELTYNKKNLLNPFFIAK